jgi:hypothetical protein
MADKLQIPVDYQVAEPVRTGWDWLSFSVPTEDHQNAQVIALIRKLLHEHDSMLEFVESDHYMRTYRCSCGCMKLRSYYKSAHEVFIMSGSSALIAPQLNALKDLVRITRLDAAIDYVPIGSTADGHPLLDSLTRAYPHRRLRYLSDGKTWTIYVGAPTSEFMIRIYQSGIQHRELDLPPSTLRFELRWSPRKDAANRALWKNGLTPLSLIRACPTSKELADALGLPEEAEITEVDRHLRHQLPLDEQMQWLATVAKNILPAYTAWHGPEALANWLASLLDAHVKLYIEEKENANVR